jgi:hypothetical protein
MEIFMKKSPFYSRVLGTALTLAFSVITDAASSEDIKVKLSGAEETPAVETSASGSGKISIAADHSVSGDIKTKKIDGTAAHIHVGAPGESGPPIITLVKGEDGEWKIPAGAQFNAEQYTAFKEGKLYVNVHSAAHKPGEIRGQLKP